MSKLIIFLFLLIRMQASFAACIFKNNNEMEGNISILNKNKCFGKSYSEINELLNELSVAFSPNVLKIQRCSNLKSFLVREYNHALNDLKLGVPATMIKNENCTNRYFQQSVICLEKQLLRRLKKESFFCQKKKKSSRRERILWLDRDKTRQDSLLEIISKLDTLLDKFGSGEKCSGDRGQMIQVYISIVNELPKIIAKLNDGSLASIGINVIGKIKNKLLAFMVQPESKFKFVVNQSINDKHYRQISCSNYREQEINCREKKKSWKREYSGDDFKKHYLELSKLLKKQDISNSKNLESLEQKAAYLNKELGNILMKKVSENKNYPGYLYSIIEVYEEVSRQKSNIIKSSSGEKEVLFNYFNDHYLKEDKNPFKDASLLLSHDLERKLIVTPDHEVERAVFRELAFLKLKPIFNHCIINGVYHQLSNNSEVMKDYSKLCSPFICQNKSGILADRKLQCKNALGLKKLYLSQLEVFKRTGQICGEKGKSLVNLSCSHQSSNNADCEFKFISDGVFKIKDLIRSTLKNKPRK